MADLNMLMTETPQGRYPYAGIPWYSTTFGRDGIITALQMLWVDPRVARGVLKRLALLPGQGGRSARRRRARQDPARNARRRNGGAARGAVRAILRQRRCHAAVRAARRSLRRAHRRRRDAGRAVAGDRGGAALDRRSRRSRRRRLRRISARHRAGARQSGLEGFLRRDLPRRRPLAEGNIALAEVQGYVFAGKAAGGALRARGSARSDRRVAWRSRLRSSPSVSRKRSGARNSAPTRWRSTARSSRARCAPPMPASCCSAACARRTARDGSQPI